MKINAGKFALPCNMVAIISFYQFIKHRFSVQVTEEPRFPGAWFYVRQSEIQFYRVQSLSGAIDCRYKHLDHIGWEQKSGDREFICYLGRLIAAAPGYSFAMRNSDEIAPMRSIRQVAFVMTKAQLA